MALVFKPLNFGVVCNTAIDSKHTRLLEQKQKVLSRLENWEAFPEKIDDLHGLRTKVGVTFPTENSMHKSLCLKGKENAFKIKMKVIFLSTFA